MGYFSELEIELQDDWQEEQRRDEEEQAEEMSAFVNSTSSDFEAELGPEELAHIEAQAEIQEYIHNGYGE
jgi:hypothetical protein